MNPKEFTIFSVDLTFDGRNIYKGVYSPPLPVFIIITKAYDKFEPSSLKKSKKARFMHSLVMHVTSYQDPSNINRSMLKFLLFLIDQIGYDFQGFPRPAIISAYNNHYQLSLVSCCCYSSQNWRRRPLVIYLKLSWFYLHLMQTEEA